MSRLSLHGVRRDRRRAAAAAGVSVSSSGGVLFRQKFRRLNDWLRSTKLYRENIADLAAGRGMTKKAKRRVMVSLSLLMGIGFVVMSCKGVWIGCAALAVVWIVHMAIFLFRVKTIDASAN